MKTRINAGQASRLSPSSNPPLGQKPMFRVGRVSPLRAALPSPWRARSDAPCLLVLALLLSTLNSQVSIAFAQLVADSATNTLSNVTNNIPGNLTVGTNGSFTLLVLSDNVLVTNSLFGNGIIGANVTAKSNEVRLVSPTARWLMAGTLFVGSNGAFNRLVVSNGATVFAARDGLIGSGTNANGSAVTLTDPGTSWQIGNSLHLGSNGGLSRLVVSNGALVRAGVGYLGSRPAIGSNVALVTGSGSVWSNASQSIGAGLWVGQNSSGNQLVVSNGGAVVNAGGGGSVGNGASNNLVLVTGAGSLWTNFGDLTLGFANVNNGLRVEDGGQVFNEDGYLGGTGGSKGSNNFAVVSGGGSLWKNRDLRIGPVGFCTLMVSNGGKVLSRDGYLGSGGTQSRFNLASVTGSGSTWSNQLDLTIGNGGPNNTLLVSNGALATSRNAVVGSASASSNNVVWVSGAASRWNVGGFTPGDLDALTLGDFSAGNQLVVSNGGTVQVIGGYLTVGNTNSAVSNSVTLTGTGTSLTVSSGLLLNPHFYVGKFGSYARLVVEDGAMLKTYSASVGTFGTGSVAVVTGPGTLWTNSSVIFLSSIQGDRLVVSNGAMVQTRSFTMQDILGADAAVSGAGSAMTVSETLAVGAGYDGNNHMVIDNGAVVKSGDCFIGIGYLTDNNAILVSGVGSVFTNASFMEIGTSNEFNRLVVSNGATVFTGDASLGSQDNGRNNEALVTGAGSVWSNSTLITVGGRGHDNRLIISGGGAVYSGGSGVVVGETSLATNNRVIVDGTLRATNASGTATLDVRRGTNVFNSGLIDVDQLLLTHPGTNVVTNVFTGTYGSSGTISIPAGGPASPYPSTFGILNATGLITKVTVTLSNLSHAHPADLSILLVSPAGQKVMLMSDAGGTNDITNVRLTFQDGTNFLPSVGPLTNGTYRPTDYVADDTLPSPAPPRPYSTELFSFNGSSPNGLWKLYVSDDINPDSGSLVGWGLRIETVEIVVLDQGRFEFNGGTLITRGAVISNGLPFIVGTSGGTPAVWDVRAGVTNTFVAGDVTIGSSASFNQLILTNGALLTNSGYGYVGKFATTSNSATLGGAGSRWLLQDDLIVGGSGVGHRLLVNDGALLGCASGAIGNASGSSSNLAVVTGSGSGWTMGHDLSVGNLGPANTLVVSNNAVVSAGERVFIGVDTVSTNNRLTVAGGTLRVTNAMANGLLEIRRGTTVLNSGLIEADVVRMTNAPQGILTFNGGTLSAKSSQISSGTILQLGNGVSPATLFLAGNSVHNFGGNLLTMIASNAVLTGNGTLLGGITIASGGKLVPGASVGKLVFSNSPALQGAVIMEINKNGATLTNDQVQVSGTLTYGGTLTVTNIGPTALAAGDRFPLFSAMNYAGSFTSLTLPPLSAGLDWTNKLLVDGSIEVVPVPPGDRFWTNALGGSYEVAANWLDNFPPRPQDNANFTNNADYQVNWSADALAANAFFNAQTGNVTQAISAFAWTLTNSYVVGRDASATATVAHGSGTLRVTNSQNTAPLIVGQSGGGTFKLLGGEVVADTLLATNGAQSVLHFISGALRTRNTAVSNGSTFFVGDGTRVATLALQGGTHSFANQLFIGNNATLAGNGTVIGLLVVAGGGNLSPGASLGVMVLSNPPVLSGVTLMEISRSGATTTNDQLQVAGPLTYGGTLTVTNIGTNALRAGDRFQLFSATSYAGSFTSLNLPPLGPGLSWRTNHLVDGSLEVFAPPAIPLSSGSYTQNFDSLGLNSLTFWRDNSTLLGWYAAQFEPPTNITGYIISDGSLNNGGLYAFGSTVNELALGSIGSSSVGAISYGLCFSNDTANSMSNFKITYMGEQWRSGDPMSVTNTLSFWYRVSGSVITNPEPGAVTNWTAVTNLDFLSPTVGVTAGALDGNQPANRHAFPAILIAGLTVPPGQHVFFRWRDINDPAPDQGIALDDLIVEFSAQAPPQITSVTLDPINGFPKIFVLGEPNENHGIEVATNLNPPIVWQRIASPTADGSGVFQFTDTNALSSPVRFYRALFP